MRVSDAIRFDLAVVQRGESGLWIYGYVQRKRQRTKQPVQVEAFIPNRLKTAIDKCKWLSTDKPFWYGPASKGYKLAYQVYDLMQTLGKRRGVDDCRPHRLRDTFAVRALLRGIDDDASLAQANPDAVVRSAPETGGRRSRCVRRRASLQFWRR